MTQEVKDSSNFEILCLRGKKAIYFDMISSLYICGACYSLKINAAWKWNLLLQVTHHCHCSKFVHFQLLDISEKDRSQCWKSTSCKVRMILWRYTKKASGIFIHFSNTSLTCTTQYRTKCPRKIWTRMNLETSTFVSTELLFDWVREVLPWNFILLQLSAEKNNGHFSPWKTKSARWEPSRFMKQQGSQRDHSKRSKEESGRRFKQKPHLVLKSPRFLCNLRMFSR